MDQKNLLAQAIGFLQSQQRYRRWLRVVTAMAAMVVFVTTYLLILPAITMNNNSIQVETSASEYTAGDTATVTIKATANDQWDQTVFVLAADGNNAGLDETKVPFGQDNTATVTDQSGKAITLYREQGDGGVFYYFLLDKEQSATFDLPWSNGITTVVRNTQRPEALTNAGLAQPEEESTEEVPVEDPLAEEVPVEETAEEPTAEEPTEETSETEPAQEDAAMTEPTQEESTAAETPEETPAEETAETEPAQEETPVEEPTQEPTAEEPAQEETPAEEPTQEPAVEEPAQEEPTAEEAPVEEAAPAAEPEPEPTQEEAPAEEPAAQPAAQSEEPAPAEPAPASVEPETASVEPAAQEAAAQEAAPASAPNPSGEEEAGPAAQSGSVTLYVGSGQTLAEANESIAKATEPALTLSWEEVQEADIATLATDGDGVEPQAEDTADLGVNSITGTGTEYDPTTGNYNTSVTINFTLNKDTYKDKGIRTYTYTYPAGVIIPDNLLNTDHTLLDTSRTPAGTYRFTKNDNGTYTVTATLSEEYVKTAGDTITGYIGFSGSVDGDSVKEDGSIELVGSDGVKLTIPAGDIKYPEGQTNKYDITTEKSGSYITTDGDKLIYTVYIRTTKGTPNPITFTDSITANGLTLGTPEVTVERGMTYCYKPGGPVDQGTFVTVQVDNTGTGTDIKLSLPGLKVTENAGYDVSSNQDYDTREFYKITYTYNLSDVPDGLTTVNNSATATATDNSMGQTVTDTDTSTVTVNKDRSYTVDKSGWYNGNTGQIEWTITVNKNGQDLAGTTLTDEMLKRAVDGTISISPADGYTLDQANGTINFNAMDGGTNTNTYTIKYSTPVEGSWDGQTVTNNATLDGGNMSEGVTGTGTVNVGGQGNLGKAAGDLTATGDGTGTIPWTVTLEVPQSGLPADTTLTDNVTQGQWGATNTSQWLTKAQADALANELRSQLDAGDITVTFYDANGTEYPSGSLSDGVNYTRFTVNFPTGLAAKDGGSAYTFTYHTTVDLTNAAIGTTTFYNTVRVGNKTAYAEKPYYKPGVVKMDGSNHTDTSDVSNADGSLTWVVEATMDDSDRTSVTITDTLPAGVTLTSLKIQRQFGSWGDCEISSSGGTGDIGEFHFNCEVTTEGNQQKIVVTITKPNGTFNDPGKFHLTYYCQLSEDLVNAGEAPGLKNSVTVTTDTGADWGSDDQTQNWTKQEVTEVVEVVDKSGAWLNNDRQAQYSILLNPEGKDLVEGADTLTLTDTLTYWDLVYARPEAGGGSNDEYSINFSLIQGSVKLYQAVQDADGNWIKGDEVHDWRWTYRSTTSDHWVNNVISADGIPDATPLILEYAYSVTSEIPEHYISNSRLDIRNTANLAGAYKDDYTSDNDWQWKDSETSGAVTTGRSYTFYKVEAGNYNNTLPGAEFSVYACGADGEATGDAVKTYTTDSNGMFRIVWEEKTETETVTPYQYNTLYKVVETKAPDGYLIPDPAPEYYFYFSSTTDTEHQLPSDLPANAVDLSAESGSEFPENIKNTTEITVNKQWLNSSGGDVTGSHGSGEVTINLYRTAQAGSSGGSGGSGGSTANFKLKFSCISDYSVQVQKAVGTVAHIEFTDSWGDQYTSLNGITVNGSSVSYGKVSSGNAATFSLDVTISGDTEVVVNFSNQSNLSSYNVTYTEPSNGDSGTPGEGETTAEKTQVDTVTIDASKNWSHTFTGLPLSGTDSEGNPVTYYYSVEEVSVPNYNTSYTNNGGITSGTIKVTNQATENPSYVLPETGGPGTLWYTIGGLALMGLALLMYKHRRGKGDETS